MLLDNVDKILLDIFKGIGIIMLLIGLILFKAFVFLQMWAWFIIPSFASVPILNYPKAIGIMGLVVLITSHKNPKNDNNTFVGLLNGYFYVTVCLFIAWIVQIFM